MEISLIYCEVLQKKIEERRGEGSDQQRQRRGEGRDQQR